MSSPAFGVKNTVSCPMQPALSFGPMARRREGCCRFLVSGTACPTVPLGVRHLLTARHHAHGFRLLLHELVRRPWLYVAR
jgi:hypothetical protein